MNKIAVALTVAFAISSAYAQVIDGETTGEQVSGAWSSFMLAKNDDVRFRAFTFSENVGLSIDVIPPSCTAIVSFVAPYSQPADADAPPMVVPTLFRIDSGALYSVSSTAGATRSTPACRSISSALRHGRTSPTTAATWCSIIANMKG